MKTVGSRELKNRLGQYLGLARRGETINVTARGKSVARILPPLPEEDKSDDWERLLRRLEAEGHMRRAAGTLKRRTFKPIVTRGKPASRMVMEDRE
jgi:prevent-host-death family protein